MRGCGDSGRGSNERGKGLKRSGSYGRGPFLTSVESIQRPHYLKRGHFILDFI